MKKVFYLLPDQHSIEQFLQEIENRFLLQQKKERKLKVQYLDSFDWRLYGKGRVCCRTGRKYTLSDFKGKEKLTCQGSMKKYPTLVDFPEFSCEKALKPLGRLRALVDLGSLQRTLLTVDLLNKNRTIVAQLQIQRDYSIGDGENTDVPALVGITGFRGDEKAFSRVNKILQGFGCKERFPEELPLRQLLDRDNRQAMSYSSKLSLQFSENISMPEAAKHIFLHLFDTAQRNLPGVAADIDTEFLHDFRVSLRRSRSLLSSLKKLIAPDAFTRGQTILKEIGRFTGTVRDLDVYLLDKNNYFGMLPKELHLGLEEFFLDLNSQRKKAFLLMKRHVQSVHCQDLLADWFHFLNEELVPSFKKKGCGQCKGLACKAIGKRFHRIVTDGENITVLSPDESLHRLRIQGKKLRYLFEFYGSFLPKSAEKRFVGQLKKLQNNLGDLNDISVQKEMIVQYQKQLKGRNRRNLFISASLGGLITELELKHGWVRKKFAKTFSHFICTENKRLLIKLVGADPAGTEEISHDSDKG